MASEKRRIARLLDKLESQPLIAIPAKGTLDVPAEPGVYIIYGMRNRVLHVGRSSVLSRRLGSHLRGRSSFMKKEYDRKGEQLRSNHKFRFLVVDDWRERALLEHLAVGVLCPKHLGTGERTPKDNELLDE